ncbi:MAG: hypothetical protein KGJ84_14100 [Elusimicrobia bacterium]|nr:hypothetical protein [Elusimicrobiota bacterium]
MAVQSNGNFYEVAAAVDTSQILSPSGFFLAAVSATAPSGWTMIDVRSGRVEKYAGKGSPEISDNGDYLFYVNRTPDAADRFPGQLLGEFHFSSNK